MEIDCFFENPSSMVLNVAVSQYNADIMPQEWKTKVVDGVPIDILNIPYYQQDPTEGYCYVHSLWMVLSYFKNAYPSRVTNSNTPNLSIRQIKYITKTHRSGTREQNLVRNLGTAIPSLKFELMREGNFGMIEDLIKKAIPVIVLYCGDYYLYRERGGGHAGVVVGITEDKIVLNNPWLGYEQVADKSEFQDAWELEYRTFIKITPTYQTNLRKIMEEVGSDVN